MESATFGHVREDGLVELPTGVALQFQLIAPPPRNQHSGVTATRDGKLAVCLHPWSWLGGRMNDPVLHSLTGVLQEQGYHILRYNSRAVGRSTGRASFTGFDEGKDLEAIVQWAAREVKDVSTVVIIGYSHGALITTLHPTLDQDPPPFKLAYVLLSYPLGTRGILTRFKGSYYEQKLDELVSAGKSKVLIAFGGHDEFTAFGKYNAWAAQLESKAFEEPDTGEKVLRVLAVPGASHFWLDETHDTLCAELSSWLSSLYVPNSASGA
ncbi:Alpha/Beta hydrolase protein [Ephemerocybe angulata]|uniref:Alpha/Beta hydrolase protein n=1 Tax=Ephemerocybe angulata TaxID=980116 RepID=A0A8H6I4Q7_9AGAR|nr:Alpha/Beta hydrolase protein [Tulosesus angulatus]